MLGSDFAEVLRCIRCGACMNHCPVYQSVGGHAYGSVYPGPIGAVMTPALIGIENAVRPAERFELSAAPARASVPVRIPLPKLMRFWRERAFERHIVSARQRFLLAFWGFFAKRPALYRFATQAAVRALALIGGEDGRLRKMPSSWTASRDFPAPQGGTFQAEFARRKSTGPEP